MDKTKIYRYIKSFASSRYKKSSNDEEIWQDFTLNYKANEKNIADTLAPCDKKFIIEIGCGCGDFAKIFLENNDNCLYLAMDVYRGGIINSIKKVKNIDIKSNIVKFHNEDGRIFIDNLDEKIKADSIFILFPDPWPKRKHNERRIINRDYVLHLLSRIKEHGKIVIATDDFEYQEHIFATLSSLSDSIEFCALKEDEILAKFPYYKRTKYHDKAVKAGRSSIFFIANLKL
ncbi:class I SAM-dependent methyltransferase [Candidatus Deianiraea vastatrix]|uniref:tRNA (guanine-N(7)-)-methyltransferase n=1 Tax=Candidatus Deianiraea vastatrix TaxID=2163644 RepID=A0A5B8XCQ2_9RICK|nr:hypothetical protein [Candidatus Deianiraea vastatrix]QED23138.1 tRNA (guanine-N(7)-)-methyltransferase [Candidatus Deianiraea vastatrix]